MFWSAGMWTFTIGVLLEMMFALNISPEPLIALYLFLVAVLVELLALGSIQLIGSNVIKRAYYTFCVITTAFIAYSLLSTNITNFIKDYIAYGNPPLLVIVSSSLVTFPAAVVLIAVAVKSYMRTRSYKMLSIIAGVIIVSIAGTLYIAQGMAPAIIATLPATIGLNVPNFIDIMFLMILFTNAVLSFGLYLYVKELKKEDAGKPQVKITAAGASVGSG